MVQSTDTLILIHKGDTVSPESESYVRLNAAETKARFQNLDERLGKLANDVANAIEIMIPLLAEMQDLLSQRGQNRETVLRGAGCPSWQDYISQFAKQFGRSLRTVQRRLKAYRERGSKSQERRVNHRGANLNLSRGQQRALVDTQSPVNDVISAYEGRGETTMVYKPGGACAETFVRYLHAFETSQPDWRALLGELLGFLGQYQDSLPVPVRERVSHMNNLFADDCGCQGT
jgi:hypothetical protein